MDWNNDGKHDWKDDAIFHNVIDSGDKDESKNTHVGRGSNSSAGQGGWISTILALGYLSVLLPGDIPIKWLYNDYWFDLCRGTCSEIFRMAL